MTKVAAIKGFADIFTPESLAFTYLENKARDTFSAYGYEEIRTPILEYTNLFSRSIGGSTDIVQKEMFTFPDRKNRSLTMRPEATAGIMRAFINSNLGNQQKTTKLFTFGPMFRYERPQKGRMRQFHQIDCECLGADDPFTDAEVIMMLNHFLSSIELKNLVTEVNSLGCHVCRPPYKEKLLNFLANINAEELCEDCQSRMHTNPLRVLDCKNPKCIELIKEAPAITDNLCENCEEHFNIVKSVLKNSNVSFKLNPRLVRGLDYYCRTTFEVISTDIGAQGSVAGGGRFDGLIAQLGGQNTPGIGFACGMERLMLVLEHQNNMPKKPSLDFFIATLDKESLPYSLSIAQRLRLNSLKGEASFAAESLKSQMRQATKTGARFTFIVGEQERTGNSVQIKDMESGNQELVSIDKLDSWIQNINKKF